MWEETLSGIETAALDCFQANLAVLADQVHGRGTHLRLGAVLAFTPSVGTPLPTVDPGLDGRLAEAEQLLGLVVRHRRDRADGTILRTITVGDPVYVVTDAYDLPWVPYFRNRHIEHSFLLIREGSDFLVVDAYHNDTPWGAARPSTVRLSPAELDQAISAPRTTGLLIGGARELRPVDTRIETPAPAAVAAYIAAYRDHPDRMAAFDQLTLETWLLARARRIHAAWTGTSQAAERAAEWSALAEQAYLAMRRVARGRPEPPGVFDRMADLFATGEGHTSDSVRDVVVGVAGEVLGTDTATLNGLHSLADLPTFSSFRLIDIIERVEHALGVELPPAALVPEDLHDLDMLSRLFAGSLEGARSHA